MRKLITFALLSIVSKSVIAGGYHFEVIVDALEVNEGSWHQYLAVLRPTGKAAQWPEEQCKEITIEGEYDALRWATYKRPMSADTHKQSILHLSSSIGKSMLFGVMGSGLKEINSCHFVSKGLFIEPYGKSSVVMSVHDRI